MKEKKRIINMRVEFDLYSKLMREEDFFKKFELSIELTNELIAEDAMFNLEFTDRQLTKSELNIEFFSIKER